MKHILFLCGMLLFLTVMSVNVSRADDDVVEYDVAPGETKRLTVGGREWIIESRGLPMKGTISENGRVTGFATEGSGSGSIGGKCIDEIECKKHQAPPPGPKGETKLTIGDPMPQDKIKRPR